MFSTKARVDKIDLMYVDVDERMPSNRWSPAEATQILVRNIRTPSKGLFELSDCEDLDD